MNLEKEVQRLRDRQAERVEGIRQQTALTPDARTRLIARVHRDARAHRDQLLARHEEQVRDDARRAERLLFGIVDPGNGAAVVAFRDAQDRVRDLNGHELSRLLEEADAVGDEVLARAVAHRAIKAQSIGIVKEFVARRPALQPSVEQLWNAAEGFQPARNLQRSIENAVPPPAELAGLTFAALQQLADEGDQLVASQAVHVA